MTFRELRTHIENYRGGCFKVFNSQAVNANEWLAELEEYLKENPDFLNKETYLKVHNFQRIG